MPAGSMVGSKAPLHSRETRLESDRAGLGRAVADPADRGQERQAEKPADLPCQELGLVVPAFPASPTVKRHGHDGVRRRSAPACTFRQQLSNCRCKGSKSLVFEMVDRLADGALHRVAGMDSVEGRGGWERRVTRSSGAQGKRPLGGAAAVQARLAQVAALMATAHTAGREEQVEQLLAHGFQRGHVTPQASPWSHVTMAPQS